MAVDPPLAEAAERTEVQKRNAWFTSTPDPWREIVRLAHGGDRTFASTVSRMVTSAEPAQHAAMEQKLLEALASAELSGAARNFICRMLGLIGSAACVPAVAPLLHDHRTADVARVALDGIEDSRVDDAYRAALDSLTGSAKAGLIGSMGLRGDRQAVPALMAVVANVAESATVRVAAQRALERIAAGAAQS